MWVLWIELGLSGEFHGVELSCIIYTRKSGLPMRDRIFENFRKSKYRSKFLIWFLGITHQRVSLEKLWAIRKNWSCPEILDGYRKSLLTNVKASYENSPWIRHFVQQPLTQNRGDCMAEKQFFPERHLHVCMYGPILVIHQVYLELSGTSSRGVSRCVRLSLVQGASVINYITAGNPDGIPRAGERTSAASSNQRAFLAFLLLLSADRAVLLSVVGTTSKKSTWDNSGGVHSNGL